MMAAATRTAMTNTPPLIKIVVALAIVMFMFFDASIRQTSQMMVRPILRSEPLWSHAKTVPPKYVLDAQAAGWMCPAEFMASESSTPPSENQCVEESPNVVSVWAYDGAPSHLNFDECISAKVLCGNTKCMNQRSSSALTERLLVQNLCKDSPVEDWCRFHVQSKLLSAHEYEGMLQVVMQLLALYKDPSATLIQPGVHLPKNMPDEWIATADGKTNLCQTHLLEAVGPGGLFGAKLKKTTVKHLLENFVKLYYANKYSRDSWPYKVDWTLVFADYCHLMTPVKFMAQPVSLVSRRQRYGTLSYQVRRQYLQSIRNNGMNIGDEMQGLAGLQFLPYVDTMVERDNYTLNFATEDIDRPMRVLDRTLLFLNAWYGDSTLQWPPPPHLDPVLVAIHTESTQKTFKRFDPGMEYMSTLWPIGVRDLSTHNYFLSKNVSNFVSNCMTTTIMPLCPVRENRKTMFVVDTSPELLENMVPSNIREQTTLVTHKSKDQTVNSDPVARYLAAFDMLHRYACEASLLITTRLHAALPSAASGTPVVWLKGDASALPGGGKASRVSDYYKFFHVLTNENDGKKVQWKNPPKNPNSDKREGMRNRLRVMAYCHSEAIKDAAVKFGTIPSSWHDHFENAPTCSVGDGDDVDSRVNIAVVVDLDILKQDHLLPSFVNSIAKNHKDPVAIHVLTRGLNAAQKCITHFLVKQPLPRGSSVSVQSLDDCGEKSDIGVIASLPTLLPPCVSKVLLLKVRTRVVAPLDRLYRFNTPACGIAGSRTGPVRVIDLGTLRDNSKQFYQAPAEFCSEVTSLKDAARVILVRESKKWMELNVTTADALAVPWRDE